MNKKHIGSSLDDFLWNEGLLNSCSKAAHKLYACGFRVKAERDEDFLFLQV